MTVKQMGDPPLSNMDRKLLPKIFNRVTNFVFNRVIDFNSDELQKIVNIPSDSMMLLELVKQTDPSIYKTNPLAEAEIRGIKIKQDLLETEGGTISSKDVADILKISRQAVDKRRKSGHLIGLSVGRRGYRYPVWQFTPTGTLNGLKTVLSELSDHDPWMQMIFMLNPNTHLGGETPLNKLRDGEVDEVITASKSYGEHGAT